MKGIGILPGFRPHYIDHLVPLCHCMQVPILVTHSTIAWLIQLYYPPMEVILVEASDYSLDEVLAPYDTFFYVDFSRKGHGTFQFHEYVTRKKARSVISLHGNPDKYGDVYWLEHLMDEDILLAYGPQMKNLLKQKGIKKDLIQCGNYRLEFYKEHEEFFDSKVCLKKEKRVALYMPTWSAKERNSQLMFNYTPFFDIYRDLFSAICQNHQLIVKIHPLMSQCCAHELEEIKASFPEILFLEEFPLVYPLLKQVDVYLGDFSSVGYDFLFFDRPLFFLETDVTTPLHKCGHVLQRGEWSNWEEGAVLESRKKMYDYAFGEKKQLSALQEEIKNALR